jgi:hypothetical protein
MLFVSAIKYLERGLREYLKLPKIAEAVTLGESAAKKHKAKQNALTPRFQKLIDQMHAMFDGVLTMEVVPVLQGGRNLNMGERKVDHTLNTIFYSKDCAKSLQKLIIKEGVMALAIQEAYYWSRALSMKDNFITSSDWASNYQKLMTSFRLWAKNPKAPRTLIKRPAKKKAVKLLPVVTTVNKATEFNPVALEQEIAKDAIIQ